MIKNLAKAKLKSGKPILGIMATIPAVQVIDILASCNLDYIVIDTEHSAISQETLYAMIGAMRDTKTTPAVRVPKNDPWMVKKVLDYGAQAILFPHICTAEDAREAVKASLYHPEGRRGWGPYYASKRFNTKTVEEYTANANKEIMVELLVEDFEALKNLEEMAKVPGVDMIALGQGDLAVDMGYGHDPEHPEVEKVMREAEKVVLKSGAALGGRALRPENVEKMLKRGYRYITMDFDFRLLQRACEQIIPKG